MGSILGVILGAFWRAKAPKIHPQGVSLGCLGGTSRGVELLLKDLIRTSSRGVELLLKDLIRSSSRGVELLLKDLIRTCSRGVELCLNDLNKQMCVKNVLNKPFKSPLKVLLKLP